MSRDDGLLYPGSSSASFTTPRAAELAKAKKEASQHRDETRTRLEPQAEELMELVEGYKKTLMSDLAHLTLSMDVGEDRVIAELRAIQLNLQFIDSFKLALGNLMRRK